ncbi:MAG: MoaD/ThiS family protein [Gammaproteobacteria bacterium]|nr:MoaD/ThiS family protein [Gammaproteobacteria bacterium]
MAKLLYFAALADRLGCTAEKAALPPTVTDVRTLLAWLRGRGGVWEQFLMDNAVRVTVSRQFATLDTPINDQHEIALLSTTLR